MLSIPFSGSKKSAYKYVKPIVESGGYDTVYEPFGGSCVLSVNLVNDGIVKRAVANDYDHFFDDYGEYLNLKDLVVAEGYRRGLRRTLTGKENWYYRINPDGSRDKIRSKVLSLEERAVLQSIIKENVPEKYWRYFGLGNNFTFSYCSTSRKITLNSFTYFNAYLKSDKQRQYLKALRRIELDHLDYREFLDKYRDSMDSRSLLILDPPYPNTSQSQYREGMDEKETHELVETVFGLGVDFIFFNQEPKKISEWVGCLESDVMRVDGCSCTTSSGRKRRDSMVYVRRSGMGKRYYDPHDNRYYDTGVGEKVNFERRPNGSREDEGAGEEHPGSPHQIRQEGDAVREVLPQRQ